MNAFRGKLLATGATLHCSNDLMDRFANWASGTPKPPQQQQQTPPQNSPQNSGNPHNSQTNPQANPENNGGTNDDLIATIWDEQQQQPPAGGNPPPNGQQPPQNNQPPQRTDEQVRAEISQHLTSVGLGDFTLSAADVEKLQGENSHQEFANLVNSRMQQVYLQSVQSAQKLLTTVLEQRIPKAIEEAVNQSKAFFNGNDLRSQLRKEIPYADDPAIGPMAETVFRQFLVKGASREKAIEHTKQYFERVRSAMDPNYVPPNPNQRTTFRGNPRQAVNFLDVLKGN